MPETALAGTVQDADTPQLPQSTRPVVAWVRQAGWFCGSDADGRIPAATMRAPLPWYQPIRRMSRWYEPALVLTLNDSVSPTFTLIEVANPTMLVSPPPDSRHWLDGVPGRLFSQAMTLTTGGPHGPAAPAGRTASGTRQNVAISDNAAAIRPNRAVPRAGRAPRNPPCDTALPPSNPPPAGDRRLT